MRRRWTYAAVSALLALAQLSFMLGIARAQEASPPASPAASPVTGGGPLHLAEIPNKPGADQPGADPNATMTLNLGEEISTGDPQVLAFLNEIEISSKVYVPLLALNEKNELASAGAESASLSPDGKTYTFKIRQGMTYSDGKPVTAGDYAYAIKRACSPEVAGDYSNILFAIVGCEEWRSADLEKQKDELPKLKAAVDDAIKATDDQTLQIQLKFPAGYFPFVMATWVTDPVRQDLVEGKGPDWWQDPKNYVGNGPFKLVSHTPKQEWVFERNDTYFRGKPGIAKLVYREIESSQTELLAYQKKEFDIAGPSSTLLKQIEADPTLKSQLRRQTGANTYYIVMNMSAKPFDSLKVRQAIAAALNREGYIKQVLNGVGQPAGTFLYPGIPGYQEQYQQKYDPAKAKQLLAEAGYPDGKGFPTLPLRYVADDAASQQAATYWAQNLKQVLGINIEPTPVDGAQLQKMRTKRDPSMIIYTGNWFEDYPHPQDWLSLVFGPGSTRAPLGWKDQHFYDLVTKADQLPIEQARPLYEQADAYLAEQAPVAFYMHSESLVLIQPYVKGYVSYPTAVVDTTYQMEKIYLTKKS